jgi:hypothetical protein
MTLDPGKPSGNSFAEVLGTQAFPPDTGGYCPMPFDKEPSRAQADSGGLSPPAPFE